MTKYPELSHLAISSNKIEQLEAFNPLIKLKNLNIVDFSDNPVTEKDNYRNWLFEKIESLEVVDGIDK